MPRNSFPNVVLVYNRFKHHSDHSGYDRLSEYLGCKQNNPSIIFRISGFEFAAKQFAFLRGYDPDLFYKELSEGISMLWKPRSIYHFFYGDKAGKYYQQYPGSGRHKIMASFHMPPNILTGEDYGKSYQYISKLDAAIILSHTQLGLLSTIIDPEKIYFVPHGIDTKIFTPPVGGNVRKENNTILCVGQTFRDFAALYAVMIVINKYFPSTYFVLIAHSSGIEEDLAKLTRLPNFEFRSGVSESDLISAYQNSQILFLPLKDSTANNALLEGMSCGLPVVVTDVGGVKDYVKKDYEGLVPYGDPVKAADIILDLLNDEGKRKLLGESNREQALCFDWPIIADQMMHVYEQVWNQ